MDDVEVIHVAQSLRRSGLAHNPPHHFGLSGGLRGIWFGSKLPTRLKAIPRTHSLANLQIWLFRVGPMNNRWLELVRKIETKMKRSGEVKLSSREVICGKSISL